MPDKLLSDSDLLGLRFHWSGMVWTVREIRGGLVLVLRAGETPADPTKGWEPHDWLLRETVEALVFASSADFPTKATA